MCSCVRDEQDTWVVETQMSKQGPITWLRVSNINCMHRWQSFIKNGKKYILKDDNELPKITKEEW